MYKAYSCIQPSSGIYSLCQCYLKCLHLTRIKIIPVWENSSYSSITDRQVKFSQDHPASYIHLREVFNLQWCPLWECWLYNDSLSDLVNDTILNCHSSASFDLDLNVKLWKKHLLISLLIINLLLKHLKLSACQKYVCIICMCRKF